MYRYGEVVVVIGVNPNKQYQVTPKQRKDLLVRMLQQHSLAAQHVRVEGKQCNSHVAVGIIHKLSILLLGYSDTVP